jgi:hypothetical protein
LLRLVIDGWEVGEVGEDGYLDELSSVPGCNLQPKGFGRVWQLYGTVIGVLALAFRKERDGNLDFLSKSQSFDFLF